MKLGLAIAVTAVAIAAAITGSAATLGGIAASGLGAGFSAVGSCDADGVDASYTVTAGAVQSITLTGIAGGCANGLIQAVLVNASDANIGSGGPATVTGTSITLNLSPQPQATAVTGVHVSIDGP
jgi:hypothetical protein